METAILVTLIVLAWILVLCTSYVIAAIVYNIWTDIPNAIRKAKKEFQELFDEIEWRLKH